MEAFAWLSILLIGIVNGQFEIEEEEYLGRKIGSINSYHHQVRGEVYAVDAHMMLLTNFEYDGNGKDTFFWAGSTNKPGIKGFLVPDKNGKTNVLDRYYDEKFTLTLPSQKRITDIKWFSVFDVSTQSNFGDIYIPANFEPPGYQSLTDIVGFSNGIKSSQVVVMDSKTIKIPAFSYDGLAEQVYFYAGEGPQPSSKGFIVPDELGYLAPLGAYDEHDVVLQLPGDKTIFNIDWLSVYDKKNERSLGHVIIPESLNVPPSLVRVVEHKPDLPNCVMLHKNLMVAWDSFPPQLTIQLAGFIGNDEYMSFGLSGEQGKNKMEGGDVAVAYMDEYLGHVEDYNLTANSICHAVLGQHGGACSDELLGGTNSHQLHSASRENGVTALTYRTTFNNLADAGDLVIPEEGEVSVIWAIGKISEKAHRIKEPSFHHTYSKQHVTIDFSKKDYDTCFPFTSDRPEVTETWSIPPIFDPPRRSFSAVLGPAGGKKGFSGRTGLPSSSLVWYIEGLMTPELYLRRGLTYTFKVEGGSNPRSAEFYHPLVITDEPMGGFDRLTEKQRDQVRVLAGVEFTRRGVGRATAAGRLCRWLHKDGQDRRRDDEFNSYERFRNSLDFQCEEGDYAVLEVTPNITWPDTVYYHSYTTPYMGWKIHVVDSFKRRPNFGSAPPSLSPFSLLLVLPVIMYLL